MSTAWIAEARQRKDESQIRLDRADDLIAGLASVWFREFVADLDEIVAELNKQFPERFFGDLRKVSGPFIELRCGPNPVFEASIISSKILKVTRYKHLSTTGGFRAEPDHYIAHLGPDEVLYFQTKTGQPVPPDNMSQELFAYLTE
jgi:hypothetical protein